VTAVTDQPVRAEQVGAIPRLRFWRELFYVVVFYGIYTVIRDTQGSHAVSSGRALANAKQVIRLERSIGIFHERAVQHAFASQHLFLRFCGVFYGSAHFVVTAVALIWLFRKMPARYALWRNALAITTALALIGFATYPLMPPRLLPAGYHFVDTLKTVGGLWSFDSGAMQKVSNQYAAMPSLHFAWSSWCAFVLWPGLRRGWSRALAVAYPLLTLFAIVVTANHFFLDAVAGALALTIGYLLARVVTQWFARRHPALEPAVL
jgi:hypothetical protein